MTCHLLSISRCLQESSSDESDDEDVNISGQRHRVCMTIQWPEDELEPEVSQDLYLSFNVNVT